MTQTNDPPLISSIELIPDAAEKADLDAPNDSGGKLVIGQAPNITITETAVVADAAERLALDVQEGDIAIQSNVSTSFIFTGGDNVANNWQTLDFDAVGAIDGEDINPRDITPRNITASGDISLQDLTVAGAINGADTSAAAAGEALTADGTGGFSFASVGGAEPLTFDETDLSNFVTNDSDLQNLFTQPVLTSSVINSKTAMEQMALSQTAMQEVGLSETAQKEIENSFGARRILNSEASSFSVSYSRDRSVRQREVIPETDENYAVYISKADYTGFAESFVGNAGWFDGNDNYLGQNINDVFVDTLTIGWDGGGGALNETLSGDIEAVIF